MSEPCIPSRPIKMLLLTSLPLTTVVLNLSHAKITPENATMHNATKSRDNSVVTAVLATMPEVMDVFKTSKDGTEVTTST